MSQYRSIRILLLSLLCLQWLPGEVGAQFLDYTQLNMSPEQYQPAQAAMSDWAHVTVQYRNQAAGISEHFNTFHVSGSYPITLPGSRRRRLGVGLYVLQDRTGENNAFKMQQVGTNLGVTIPLSKSDWLSFGTNLVLQTRTLAAGGLSTGSQYLPGRGFVPGATTGEPGGELQSSFLSLGAGLAWNRTTQDGEELGRLGLSWLHLNQPDQSFSDERVPLAASWVVHGRYQVWTRGAWALSPIVFYHLEGSTHEFNVGAIARYNLSGQARYRPEKHAALELHSRYAPGRAALLILQLHKPDWSAGFSYDLAGLAASSPSLGAVEVAFSLKKRIARSRGKRPKPNRRPRQTNHRPVPEAQPADTVGARPLPDTIPPLAETLIPEESPQGDGLPGEVRYKVPELEKLSQKLEFEFNSSQIKQDALPFLDQVAELLWRHPDWQIHIMGHTDDVGTETYNLDLSQSRADAISAYLWSVGVPEVQLVAEGFGESQPLVDNDSEINRARNRRVELRITVQE